MKCSEVANCVQGVPFISPERGRDLYDIVLKVNAQRALELGFAHGASSSYIAGALQETGGKLDCVDLQSQEMRKPSIQETLGKCGLNELVTVYREKSSYTWFLKKAIQENTVDGICTPIYDFIFIDGPKNWTIDGAAFFFSEKLLRAGGAIVFDDYNYAYGTAKEVTDGIHHRELGEDELTEPHIKLVFDLLVVPHPAFSEFEVINQQFGVAYKTSKPAKTVKVKERLGLREKLLRRARLAQRARLEKMLAGERR